MMEMQKYNDSAQELGRISASNNDQYPPIPLYLHAVSAGLPFPADDYIVENIDLNKHLITHPTATFLLRVSGDAMMTIGINRNDILVVDKSLTAQNGKIVVAAINGELVVRKLKILKKEIFLISENKDYKPIKIDGEDDNIIWGVVTNVIHKC